MMYFIQMHTAILPLNQKCDRLESGTYKSCVPTRRHSDLTQDRVKVEWVVQANAGGKVKFLAHHDRAGVVRAEVMLL